MSSEKDREDGSDGDERTHGRVAETIIWDEEEGDVSLVRLANVLLRHRRKLIVLPAALGIAAVLIGLVLPQTWSTSAAFFPQDEQVQSSQLGNLAAQFGVNLPIGGSAGRSPEFYADLVRSEALLKEVVRGPYVVPGRADDSTTADLVDVYDIQEPSSEREVVEAVEELRDDLSVTTVSETGVVRVSVRMPAPELSRAVAERVLELVNRFNLETRQTQASEERRFLEDRVEQARKDLLAMEDSLESFLDNNRGYENSPRLRFEYQRLQRRVDLRQQVYMSLAQSLEEARISEVRNTPVITVVEPPELPVKPDRRHLLMKALLGGFLGLFSALFWSFGVEFSRTARSEEPQEFEELSTLLGQTRDDLRSVTDRLLGFLPGRNRGD